MNLIKIMFLSQEVVCILRNCKICKKWDGHINSIKVTWPQSKEWLRKKERNNYWLLSPTLKCCKLGKPQFFCFLWIFQEVPIIKSNFFILFEGIFNLHTQASVLLQIHGYACGDFPFLGCSKQFSNMDIRFSNKNS